MPPAQSSAAMTTAAPVASEFPAGGDGNSEATGAAVVIAAEDCGGGIEGQVGSVTVFVQGMKALVGSKPPAKLLAGIRVLQVRKARAHARHGCAVVKNPELQNGLTGHAPAVKPASDVVSGGEHERVRAKRPVTGASRGDAPSSSFKRRDMTSHDAERDRLLQAPAMWRRWRSQKLDASRGQVRESGRIPVRHRPRSRRLRRTPPVEVG